MKFADSQISATRKGSEAAGPFSRRAALGLTFFGGMFLSCPIGFAATRFWNSKPSSQWTPEETTQLATTSPWAKQVMAQYRAAMENLAPDPDLQPTQGRGEATVGQCGLTPCSNIMPGQVTVIWESALPIREALHPVIPPEYNGHYVISIRGLEGTYDTDRLKEGSLLSAKGKPAIQPDLLSRRNASYIFGFSREFLPLGASDKNVQFIVHTGANLTQTLLRATFEPKEMIYRGALSL